MKKPIVILITVHVFFSFLSCMSMQQKAQLAWSAYPKRIYHYYVPHELKSSEEAVSIIKLVQSNISGDVVDLQVDQYGLILKERWVSQRTNYVVQPVTKSGFVGGKYYSNTTYVGSNVTTTDSGINSASLLFKNIRSIYFDSDAVGSNWNWYVSFYGEEQLLLGRYVKDKETAIDLINSVYTLAKKGGAAVRTGGLGIAGNPISEQQAATIGVLNQKGVVVISLSVGGPAEKAGLNINDVITHVEDNAVGNISELSNMVYKDKKKKVKLTLIRLLDFDEKKNIFNYEKIEKEIGIGIY